MGESGEIELFVRGEMPGALAGSFIVALSRRHKDRGRFSRWHDSQADLLRLDVIPGRPGRVIARLAEVDPSGADLGDRFDRSAFERESFGADPAYGYATQPNHGVNVAGGRVWATNLLFGAPLEMDLERWTPTRIVRVVEPHAGAPRLSTTAHFAWSADRSHAYFHQSLLQTEQGDEPVQASELRLVRLDPASGRERCWRLNPPPGDSDLAAANFHSAFLWEEDGAEHVGLLRTGAVLESLAPHAEASEHRVTRMPVSTIWQVRIDERAGELTASLLPGLEAFTGLAMSHLAVEPRHEGFVLYANCKQSDVAEETHGLNVYGQRPEDLPDHYAGMVVEALNVGCLLRYERKGGQGKVTVFERPYDARYASEGHTWLPINIEADPTGQALFCSFAGFRPRLLSRHVAAAYADIVVDAGQVRYVPPLIMRFDAATLAPQRLPGRGHLAYAEPIAISLVGDCDSGYLCTFSPEQGFRVLQAGDLNRVVGYAVGHDLWQWRDSHFRPDPPHMKHAPR